MGNLEAQGMNAIVIAGGIPQPDELLYTYTQGQPKALLDIGGKPMAQWVLDALGGASQVRRVVLIGLDESSGLHCTKPVTFHPNQGGMLENILFGIQQILLIDPAATHMLLVSSDIPGIKAEMVDWVVTNARQTDHDLYYHIIPQEVMEKRYPGSKRTYTRLKGAVVCGGDMNVVSARTVKTNLEKWHQLIGARKNPLKQAAIIGLDTLLLLAMRVITVDRAVSKVTRRLGVTGQAVICPYAEVGMDVDKPYQLELMREDLGR
jgi:GTP:adenosylcobinamide-phosphate guanylyltransferase